MKPYSFSNCTSEMLTLLEIWRAGREGGGRGGGGGGLVCEEYFSRQTQPCQEWLEVAAEGGVGPRRV